MTVRDHTGITLDKFNGLWETGDVDTVPLDHFSKCNNIDFLGESSFKTRPGIDISQTVLIPLSNVKRIYNYPTQTANTLIVLTFDDDTGIGHIYHVVDESTIFGPILSIAGMTDFAFQPYAGRGYISPFASSLPTVGAPGTLNATASAGSGVEVGIHSYASTFVSASGETNPSPLTTITIFPILADPTQTPLLADGGPGGGNNLVAGATYKWLFTVSAEALGPASQGVGETDIGPESLGFIAPVAANDIFIVSDTPIDTSLSVNIYRTIANGAAFFLERTVTATNINSGTIVGNIDDAFLITRRPAPTTNSTLLQQVSLTSIPISNSPIITSKKIYRTKAGATQLQLLTTLGPSVTTYLDAIADASLGADAPTKNTIFVSGNTIEKGLSGEFLYVYAGNGTPARKAAGNGTPGSMTVANGAPGHTDPGVHIFGFVSQTISGYNSPPTLLTAFTTSATSSVSFGSIPTSGDPNVVKRLLVASKVITGYNGDVEGYQLFFVPNASINNNTDTFLNNVSFFDSELLEDASHLLDNFTEIPAGAVLTLYHNRLVLGTTFEDISILLVSEPGEPEAINQITGLIVVPLDGNPITNAQELRDVLYVFKRAKTVAYADNGDVPSSWPLTIIDNALGTSVHGIATVLDSGAASVDFLIICTYQGMSQFNGRYITPELSRKINNFWTKLDRTKFAQIQIVNAPIQKMVYTILPTRQLLIGNYNNGMDHKNIRWAPWLFRIGLNTIALQDIDNVILGADIF